MGVQLDLKKIFIEKKAQKVTIFIQELESLFKSKSIPVGKVLRVFGRARIPFLAGIVDLG